MYMYTHNFITLAWETEHRLSGIVSSFTKHVSYMYHPKFIITVKLQHEY